MLDKLLKQGSNNITHLLELEQLYVSFVIFIYKFNVLFKIHVPILAKPKRFLMQGYLDQ